MKKQFFLLAFLLLKGISSFNQFETDYSPLKCQGEIPKDFISLVVENYAEDKEDKISKEDSRFEKKTKDEFLINSNSYLQEVLGSGKVLFGDPISLYISKVLDNVLKDDKELRDQISVYALKSPRSNAMATDRGIIFVTTGLISQLTNEAQLAFVLAHEVCHYTEKHSINQHIENQKILRSKGDYRNSTYSEALEAMSSFSKEHEFEADEKGIDLFLDTDYQVDQIFSVFEVLIYSYLPFDEVPFDFGLLGSEYFSIPDVAKTTEFNPIEVNEDYEDKFETHPNILKRKDKIENILGEKGVDFYEGEKFILPEEEFKKVRNLCRFETIKLNLLEGQFTRALFHISILKNEFPDNRYLDLSLAHAMYGIYKYKKHNELDRFGKTKYLQGQELAALNIPHKLSHEQLNVLALREFLVYEKKHGGSKVLERFKEDVIHDLISDFDLQLNDFKDISVDEQIAKMSKNYENNSSDSSEVSKYDKIKNSKENDRIVDYPENYFHLHCLTEFLDDPGLKEMFKKVDEEVEEEKAEEEKFDNSGYNPESYRYYKKKAKWERKYGDYLGIDKMITVNPYYIKSTERNGVDHLESEDKQIQYTEMIEENSKSVGIENTILNPFTFSSSDVEKFNDLATVNEWLLETLDNTGVDMLPISSEYTSDIVDKYGTSNIYFTGVLNNKRKKDNIALSILIGVIYFPLLPYSLYYALTPYHETLNFHFIFDLENGDAYLANIEFFNKQADADIFIESQLYGILYQIKNLPRKPEPE